MPGYDGFVGTPAEEFGPYVVHEQLGLGGMATVHRAETQGIAGFSKQVALKRMLPNVAADAGLVRSFIREARLASHLRHANVAQTYDLGKVGETYFIAMELVPGRNLREILKHCSAVCGPMPVPIALNIIAQICDALDYAHNLCDDSGVPLGIIHRDVSPANIIVSEGGVVKLIDFGIAKAAARTGMHTMTGTIKGKFSYMAPEYLMGSIDSRADLFALGVIAHELLANRPLFQGRDDMDTLYRVKDMPILAPSRINPKVPPELDAVVMTALDRDPDQRWQRANALRQALNTEIKRLNLVAHDSQVHEWAERAFQPTSKKRAFEESSEPMISISEGTSEMPSARGTPRREVPDEFSTNDGMATIVKQTKSRPVQTQSDDWNVATAPDATDHPVDGAEDDWKLGTDLPTQLVRKTAPPAARSGRASTPNVVRRNTPVPVSRNTPVPVPHNTPVPARRDTPAPVQQVDNTDELRTSRNARRDETDLDGIDDIIATLPARPKQPSTPPLAPRSDAEARTMMIDPGRADRPSQPPAAAAALLRTLPGTGAPAAVATASLANVMIPPSGARTSPRMAVADIAGMDDLAARGERPSAGKLRANAETAAQTTNAETAAQTIVPPGERIGASHFLLAVLVLIAAGGAAAVVYFALPHLT